MQRPNNQTAIAVLLPAAIGLGGAALSVREFEQYGWSLFLGLPLLVGFLSAFLSCFKRKMGSIPLRWERDLGARRPPFCRKLDTHVTINSKKANLGLDSTPPG